MPLCIPIKQYGGGLMPPQPKQKQRKKTAEIVFKQKLKDGIIIIPGNP